MTVTCFPEHWPWNSNGNRTRKTGDCHCFSRSIACALLAVAPALAQAAAPLQPSTSPETVTVGDWLTYTVEVPLAPGERVTGPGPDADFGTWEVRGHSVQPGNGAATVTYNLAAFETGELEVPAIEITVSDAQGKARTAKTEPVKVTVASVLEGAEDTAPADIVGPLTLRERPLAIALRVLVLAVAAALLVVLARLLWRRMRRHAAEASQRPDPPDVAALKALQALKAAQLPEQGKAGEHYSQLSEIIRSYLAARYGIPALQETTFHIVSEMQRAASARYAPVVEDLLLEADLVRFAKAEPDAPACYGAVDAAERLIRDTAPALAPVEQVTADG